MSKGTPLILGQSTSVYVNFFNDGIQAMQQVANLTQTTEDGEFISGIQLSVGNSLFTIAPFSALYQLGILAVEGEGFALINAESIESVYSSANAITTMDTELQAGWKGVSADGAFTGGSVDDIIILGSVTRAMFDTIFSSTPFENDDNGDNEENEEENSTIGSGTEVKFNTNLNLPTDYTEIDIQATSDYALCPSISKIKLNNTMMAYNDGNTDYPVYSSEEWASADAQTIIVADAHKVQSATEKQWWLDNTNLTTDILNNKGEISMATETKNFQIVQKIGVEEYLVLHPETTAENVLISAEGIESDNLKEALVELSEKIDDAVAGGVTSVNGQTGAVTVDKASLGLENVDNTADLDKPISEATQDALDLKANKTYVDEELEKKADISDIPDVSSFITKAVDDLVNYYTSEVIEEKVSDLEGKISAIPKFKVSVVSELPESGDDATIYLVSNSGSEAQNLYVEYIWTGSVFEKLGEQKLDLSGYVTIDALNTAIADFLEADDVNSLIESALEDYIKASEVSEIGKSGKLSDAIDDATHRLVSDTEKSNWNNAKTVAADNATEIENIKEGTTKVGVASQADSATSAESAGKLTTAKEFSASGDITAVGVEFDGTDNVVLNTVLSATGVQAGSYSAVTVDAKGRVTAGAQLVEVGTAGQSAPSANLAIGGLFFKLLD